MLTLVLARMFASETHFRMTIVWHDILIVPIEKHVNDCSLWDMFVEAYCMLVVCD